MKVYRLLALLLMLVAGSAAAGPQRGPSISFTRSVPVKDSDKNHPTLVRSWQATLFYPRRFEGMPGVFVPILHHSEDVWEGGGAEKTLKSSSWGAAYAFDNPTIRPVVRFMSYDSLEGLAKPMLEFVAGADFPGSLKIFDATESEASYYVRYRRFPSKETWLPLIFYKASFAKGLFVDAGIPSHLIVGWRDFMNQAAYAGVQATSVNYPDRIAGESVWWDGYVLKGFVGGRTPISEPFFIDLKLGAQRQHLKIYGMDDGFRPTQSRTEPFFELALETWK